MRRVSAIQKLL